MQKIRDNFLSTFILNNEDKVNLLTGTSIIEFPLGKDFFYSPIRAIRDEQQKIVDIFSTIELNNAAIAYRKGYCYFDFLEPHKNNYHFLRLDIVSFFHSIELNDIKDCLRVYFDLEEEKVGIEKLLESLNSQNIKNEKKEDRKKLFDNVINLITYKIPNNSKNTNFIGKTVLPMGFITSPVISNLVFRPLDILIQKFCLSKGIVYTRYADDMLFSAQLNQKMVHSEAFLREIAVLLNSKKFKINQKKTIKTNHTISLNGYTIQGRYILRGQEMFHPEIRLSNKKTNIIKKALYAIKQRKSFDYILKKVFCLNIRSLLNFPYKDRYAEDYAKNQVVNKLLGYRTFILSIVVYHKKKQILTEKTLEKYTKLVHEIESCLRQII